MHVFNKSEKKHVFMFFYLPINDFNIYAPNRGSTMTTGIGDRRQGARPPPNKNKKNSGKLFLGNYYVKIGHFSGKNHVNELNCTFGVSFSRLRCCCRHGHGLWPSWYRPRPFLMQVFR